MRRDTALTLSHGPRTGDSNRSRADTLHQTGGLTQDEDTDHITRYILQQEKYLPIVLRVQHGGFQHSLSPAIEIVLQRGGTGLTVRHRHYY